MHFDVDGKAFWALPDFEHLWRWLKQTEPQTAQYFDQVRNGIVGWGPKHSKMFEVFDEEGFDFKPLVARFIAANIPFEKLLTHYQRAEATSLSPGQRKALQEKLADMKEAASGAAKYSTRWDRFAEALLAFATEKAIEVYPEILASDPERIKQLGYLLYDKLRDVADGVAKLAEEAKK